MNATSMTFCYSFTAANLDNIFETSKSLCKNHWKRAPRRAHRSDCPRVHPTDLRDWHKKERDLPSPIYDFKFKVIW